MFAHAQWGLSTKASLDTYWYNQGEYILPGYKMHSTVLNSGIIFNTNSRFQCPGSSFQDVARRKPIIYQCSCQWGFDRQFYFEAQTMNLVWDFDCPEENWWSFPIKRWGFWLQFLKKNNKSPPMPHFPLGQTIDA